MDVLETRIPPPLVGLLAGLLAWAAAAALGAVPLLELPVRIAATVLLLLAGLAVAFAGVRGVRRARTTLNPLHPETATALVTAGIYARTRNPMYLGMALWLAAWAAWLATPVALLGPAAFVLFMNRFQVGPEERALTRLFGAAYDGYRARVRRWL